MAEHEHSAGPLGPLDPRDAEALDALVAADWNPMQVAPELRPRAMHVARVLGLMDAPMPVREDATRIDVTIARLGREDAASLERLAGGLSPELSPEDQEALDAWVMSGYRASRVPTVLRERAQRLEAMAALVTAPVPGLASALAASRTSMDAVMRRIAAQQSREVLSAARGGRLSTVSLRDVVSVAAVLLIAASVLWPLLTATRNYGTRLACEGNLGRVASAMGLYTVDHRDSLPMASAGFAGSWWNVGRGRDQSNSANLFTLRTNRYTCEGELACSGNPLAVREGLPSDAFDWPSLEAVSYSYALPTSDWRSMSAATLSGATIVLADRSPVVLRAVRGGVIYPNENSPNHQGRGQSLLRLDGSVSFARDPEVGGDNIWLPRPLEDVIRRMRRGAGLEPIRGVERPTTAQDVMLGP